MNSINIAGMNAVLEMIKDIYSAVCGTMPGVIAVLAVSLLFCFLGFRLTRVVSAVGGALLGGALGLVCGLVLCTVVLWAVKLVAPAAYSDAGLLSPSVMENSAIAGKLVGWNDGVSLFESNPANT